MPVLPCPCLTLELSVGHASLFTTEIEEPDPELLNKVNPKVNEVMNEQLLRPFSAEDVKKALFSIGDMKAPGSDGLHAIFFKKCGHILGDILTSEVLEAISNKSIPDGWNDTVIVLIPKVENPELVTQYRPISLCNVLYKIKNRKKGKWGYCAVKLDMHKAYDRVEWNFLEKGLSSLLAHREEVRGMEGVRVLDQYCASSGQLVSEAKCSMYFSPNVDPDVRAELCSELNVMTEDLSDKYLGLPAMVGVDRSDSFMYLLERIIKRLEGWKEKFLSMGGKEILLKAVI
ncbi:uncharacterized protein [Lolium perenne]|uniref:uncharacterized protein n=1 Tax=Lolium perenne TaxID=4522 RepID=UPI0021F5594D|nr:uncharacterized protein LOC127334729 [Lolium perenne]